MLLQINDTKNVKVQGPTKDTLFTKVLLYKLSQINLL